MESKITRSQKDKRRREKLKSENPEEYRRRQDLMNEKRKLRREKLKTENPELHKQKQEQINEKARIARQQLKTENPELHKQNLFEIRQKYLDDKIASWENLFDTYFEKNKVEMSQSKWRDLKNSEILFFDEEFDNDISIPYLFRYRKTCLEYLRKNPDGPCAASVLFYVKTFVHNEYDQHKLTAAEKEFIKTVVLDEYSPEFDKPKRNPSYRKKYYEKHREKEIGYSKSRKEKQKSKTKNENLNFRFIDADPNKVLSVSDICFNPKIRNCPIREEFKLNLWKNLSEDEKPEFLEKWRIQRENYEKEVGELSIEFKSKFLKTHGK